MAPGTSWPFGARNHSQKCAVVDGVAGGVPPADTGADADNLLSRSSSAYRTPNDTPQAQLLLRQDGDRQCRFIGAHSDLSRSASVRAILGQKAHRSGVSLDGVNDVLATSAVSTSADFSFEIVFRINSGWVPGDEFMVYHGSAMGGATRDWAIGIDPTTARIKAIFDRYASSGKVAQGTSKVQGGRIFSALISVNGTAASAVLYLNGTSDAVATGIGAHAPNSDPIVIGNAGAFAAFEVFSVSYWDAELTADQALARYDQTRIAIEANLAQGFNFTEGAGNPLNVVGGGVTMTNTGGTWIERANTSGKNLDTGNLSINGPWRQRQKLVMTSGTHLITGFNLDYAPCQAFATWITIPENTPDTLQYLMMMGGPPGDPDGRDWALRYDPFDGLYLDVRRTGITVIIRPTPILAPGTYFISGEIDSFGAVARFRAWDTSEMLKESAFVPIPAFSASAGEAFRIGGIGTFFRAAADLFGDTVVWNRIPTDTELQQVRHGNWSPLGDPETLLHYRWGDSLVTAIDHGSAGENLDVSAEVFEPIEHPLKGTVDLSRAARYDGLWGHRLAADTQYEEALFLIFDPDHPQQQIEIEQLYLFEGETLGYVPDGHDPGPEGFTRSRALNGYPYAGYDGRMRVSLPLVKVDAEDMAVLQSCYRERRLVAVLPDATVSPALTWSSVVIGEISSISSPLNVQSAKPQLYNVSMVIEGLPGWGR